MLTSLNSVDSLRAGIHGASFYSRFLDSHLHVHVQSCTKTKILPLSRKWLSYSRRVRALCSKFCLCTAEDVSHIAEDVLSEHNLRLLLRFVKGAVPKWREIGLALGFTMDVLDAIAAKPENVSRGAIACFIDLLNRWLKWAPPNHDLPTVKTLAEALREGTVGEERMAYDLVQGFERRM